MRSVFTLKMGMENENRDKNEFLDFFSRANTRSSRFCRFRQTQHVFDCVILRLLKTNVLCFSGIVWIRTEFSLFLFRKTCSFERRPHADHAANTRSRRPRRRRRRRTRRRGGSDGIIAGEPVGGKQTAP